MESHDSSSVNHTLSPGLRLIAFRGIGKTDLRPHRESSTEIFLRVNQRFALAFVSGGGQNRDVGPAQAVVVRNQRPLRWFRAYVFKDAIQVGEERRR